MQGRKLTRKLLDIADGSSNGGLQTTIWLCQELQARGVESLLFQHYTGHDEGFHRIFVHVRYLELAKRLLKELNQEALHVAN